MYGRIKNGEKDKSTSTHLEECIKLALHKENYFIYEFFYAM
jgi:hypothetical protein